MGSTVLSGTPFSEPFEVLADNKAAADADTPARQSAGPRGVDVMGRPTLLPRTQPPRRPKNLAELAN